MRIFDISSKEDLKDLSMEAIAPQLNDIYVREGLKYVEEIYSEIDNGLVKSAADVYDKSTAFSKFLNLIRKRFGINISVDKEFLPLGPAAVFTMTPDSPYNLKPYKSRLLNVGNIGTLISDTLKKVKDGINVLDIEKRYLELRSEASRILRQSENTKSVIDFKNVKISGSLSKLPCSLIVDFPFLKNTWGLTPKQTLAVITHEIGHCFDFISHLYLSETTNATLANILEEINNNNLDKAEYIYKTRFASPEEFKEYLTSERSRLVLTKYVVNSYIGKVTSQLPNDKYAQTSPEAQADEFASRFGLGKDLVAALDSNHTRYGATYNSATKKLLIINIILDIIFVAVTCLFLGRFGLHFGITLFAFLIFGHPDLKDRTYDDPKDRFNRIKNNIALMLKDMRLPDEIARDLVEQHTYITRVIENTIQYPDVFAIIASKVFPGGYNTEKYIKLQKSLENVLNNVLFVKAAELRTFKA